MGQRLTELTGSFLMAAIVSAVLCLIILVAGGRPLDASVDTWTFYAWLTVTSTVGAWLVLGLAKLWEGTDGDDILRRFVMMVAGLGIGLAAFAACDMLMIRLSTHEMFNVLDLPRDIIPGEHVCQRRNARPDTFPGLLRHGVCRASVVAAGRSHAQDAIQLVDNDRRGLRGHAHPVADSVGVPAGHHDFGGRATGGAVDELARTEPFETGRMRGVGRQRNDRDPDNPVVCGDCGQRHGGGAVGQSAVIAGELSS